jgi:hypothetical protein
MNWDAIGAVGELVGAVAVVVTLAYLASQLRQNTKALRSSTYQAFNDSSFSWADSEIENSAMIANTAHYSSLDELTPEEYEIWRGIMFKAFTVMESNYLHHRAGAMDDDIFESRMIASVNVIMQRPIWRQMFHDFPLLPEFKEYMEPRIRAAQQVES